LLLPKKLMNLSSVLLEVEQLHSVLYIGDNDDYKAVRSPHARQFQFIGNRRGILQVTPNERDYWKLVQPIII